MASLPKNLNPAYEHGHAFRGVRPNIYRRWQHMIQRCHNPNDKDYPNYGAKGITVCQRWRDSFPLFLADMGTPAGKAWTLDRIDNEGGYSPQNCRWATAKQQCNNRRNTRYLTIRGVTRPLSEWCALVGIGSKTVLFRLKHRGMTDEEAIYAPLAWTKRNTNLSGE